MVNYEVQNSLDKTGCQTQQECAQQTHEQNQKAGAEQVNMNKTMAGGAVTEINVAAGSTSSDVIQQQRANEAAMQAQEDSKYDQCINASKGAQAGCGKKKRRRRRKSRKSKKRRKSRKKSKKRKTRRKLKKRKRKTKRRRK
tara:strand:+ start:693 stop:1115 length:423 start_codon:yes stop_codon:yes gene_type:complete